MSFRFFLIRKILFLFWRRRWCRRRFWTRLDRISPFLYRVSSTFSKSHIIRALWIRCVWVLASSFICHVIFPLRLFCYISRDVLCLQHRDHSTQVCQLASKIFLQYFISNLFRYKKISIESLCILLVIMRERGEF